MLLHVIALQSSIMRLFITEKKSLAQTIANWLGKTNGQSVASFNGGFKVGNDVLLPAAGHLLQLVAPSVYDEKWKSWQMNDLPIIPRGLEFQMSVAAADDPTWGPANKARIKAIADALKTCTEVVHVGDPDDEGQAIVDNLLDHLRNQKPVHRLWAQELSDKALAKSMSNMLPNSQYATKAEYARARSQADWLYGMNYSRSATLALHHRMQTNVGVFSVGRVQTAVLGMIVRREDAILNFVPVEHYVPWVQTATNPSFKAVYKLSNAPEKESGATSKEEDVDDDKLLKDKNQAVALVSQWQQAGQQAKVLAFIQKPGVERAPLTFSLSDLQRHCNRRFGFTANQTLDAAQALYEAKLTSYPRTDVGYLPEDAHSGASAIMKSIGMIQGMPGDIVQGCQGANPSLKSRAWNSKKIASHYGIMPIELPTDVQAVYANLKPEVKKVYHEIIKRFVLQFWPDAKISTTVIEITPNLPDVNPQQAARYRARGKVYLSKGWRDAFKEDASDTMGEDQQPSLPLLKEGQIIPVDRSGFDTQHTKPPARFTEDTLLGAMEAAYKHVKDPQLAARLKGQTDIEETDERLKDNIQAGIGTQATRAEIIETLKKRGYIEGKPFTPTPKGWLLIHMLPDSHTWPDQTAIWQIEMDKIKTGFSHRLDFVSALANSLHDGVNEIWQVAQNVNEAQIPGLGRALSELRQSANQQANKSGAIKRVETSFPCPSCGSPYARLAGISKKSGKPFDMFLCTNEQCKHIASVVDERPQTPEEKQAGELKRQQYRALLEVAPTCPVCGKHKVVQRTSAKGLVFWGCTGFSVRNGRGQPECSAAFSDIEGKPDLQNPWQGASKNSKSSGSKGSSSKSRSKK